jgi:DNA-binding IclR family transcriptional regulator
MIEIRAAPAQGTQMIDRTVSLLRLVATYCPNGARLTDLAKEAGLPAPTARRILKRLIQHGLISQDVTGHRYSLGNFARELGLASDGAREEASRHRPLLETLVTETNATFYLLLRSGLDSLCIDRLDFAGAAKQPTLGVGDRLPLGAGVGGMILLAALPEEHAEQAISANASVYRRFVRTTGSSFRDHLEAARRDGYVVRRSPVTPGILGIGITLPSPGSPARLAVAAALDTAEATPSRRSFMIAKMQELTQTFTRRLC